MSFSHLGLSADLLRALTRQGYDAPTPIQARAIPAILAGSDLMASAQTGTGKTAAFTLPLLQRLADHPSEGRRRLRALVLTPTRELAAQVGESVRRYGAFLPLRCAEVYGGVNINPQLRTLRNGIDVLVATPGRLLDHLGRGTVDLSQIETLVLDEADRMLDMGFLPAIERVLRAVPASRQTLLFSATFSGDIRRLAGRFLSRPEMIEMAPPNATVDAITQSAYLVDSDRKRELLSYLIGSQNLQQVLVFTRTKRGADRLAKQLGQDGIRATAIHGNKSQAARTRALDAFKRRKVSVLAATDVAARGLDIDHLPHVINYELPNNPEDYIHRIGRTGRAGESGAAISLVSGAERGQLAAIRRLVKAGIPAQVLTGFEPTQTAGAPSRRGHTAGHRSGPRRRHGMREGPSRSRHGGA